MYQQPRQQGLGKEELREFYYKEAERLCSKIP